MNEISEMFAAILFKHIAIESLHQDYKKSAIKFFIMTPVS